MRAVPGFVVICPADAVEAEKAIVEIFRMKGPAYVRLGRGNVKTIYDDSYKFELGKASIVIEGSDAAIIASGIMVQDSMGAAELLKKEGLSARVVNMATIKPIDREAIIEAAKTGAVITAEDHNIYGGLGSAVAEVLAEEKIAVPFGMVGVKDRFAESDSQKVLFRKYGLDAEAIAEAVKRAISVRSK